MSEPRRYSSPRLAVCPLCGEPILRGAWFVWVEVDQADRRAHLSCWNNGLNANGEMPEVAS